jgi:hypothetical protein
VIADLPSSSTINRPPEVAAKLLKRSEIVAWQPSNLVTGGFKSLGFSNQKPSMADALLQANLTDSKENDGPHSSWKPNR